MPRYRFSYFEKGRKEQEIFDPKEDDITTADKKATVRCQGRVKYLTTRSPTRNNFSFLNLARIDVEEVTTVLMGDKQ